jgi:RHS repeat-associated protein
VSFSLDPLDRKATRTLDTTLSDTYAYVGSTEIAWRTGEGTPTTSLLDLDGSRLAVKTDTAVAWVIFDLHGSAVALCGAGGTSLSDAYRYDAWGEQVASSGSSTNPWRYRGLLSLLPGMADQVHDMAARDYVPGLGVFTSLDSVQGSAADPFTLNRYLYALANPATLVDPDGHRACIDVGTTCTPDPATTRSGTRTSRPSARGNSGSTTQSTPVPASGPATASARARQVRVPRPPGAVPAALHPSLTITRQSSYLL